MFFFLFFNYFCAVVDGFHFFYFFAHFFIFLNFFIFFFFHAFDFFQDPGGVGPTFSNI